MAENSGIQWTHHTFNPWTGCTAISPACDHCYAEDWAKRSGHVTWGPHGARRRTKTWGNPVKWSRQAQASGKRMRVFCASLADVFDNHASIDPAWRADLWRLIEDTPHLDWLLLTKRPQNVARMVPERWMSDGFPDHVWLGATVENQTQAERRIPALLRLPARIKFLSCEPLLGPLDLEYPAGLFPDGAEYCCTQRDCGCMGRPIDPPLLHGIDWVIAGGESGPNHRTAETAWFRDLRDQCARTRVPFLFKQWGGANQIKIKAKGRLLDGVLHDGYPEAMTPPLPQSRQKVA